MLTESKEVLSGNARFEGFGIDLVEELSKMLRFKYKIHLVKDGKYGGIDEKTGDWDGMIGELRRDEADIAVADLTITSSREKAVDFTYPFMSTGISILYAKPKTKETSLWTFLDPFSTTVWNYLFGAFVIVSLVLFFVGRFTPYEWDSPSPCMQNNQTLENNLNLSNSFWCTGATGLQQGSDIAPK